MEVVEGGVFGFFGMLYIKRDEVYGIADVGRVVEGEGEEEDMIVEKDIGEGECDGGEVVGDIGEEVGCG